MSFNTFSWKGVPIKDIHAWALERGERMVQYEQTTRTVYGPVVEKGYMPESFWFGLLWAPYTSYKELPDETT